MINALATPNSSSVWFAQALERSHRGVGRPATSETDPIGSVDAASCAGVGCAAANTSWTENEFCNFHQRTARPLAAYVQQSTRNLAITEDIVQESYLRFLRAEGAPDTERHARNYLYRIATNLMRDRYRRRDLEVPVEHDADRLTTGGEQHQVDLQYDLERSLGQLKPRDRQILWLAHVEELSHREIASVMGLREVSVRPMLFRSRQRFGRLLQRAGFEPGATEQGSSPELPDTGRA